MRNRNNQRKFGSYSRLTELTERTELHELYFAYLYFVGLCVVFYIWTAIYLCYYIAIVFLYIIIIKNEYSVA